MNNMKKPAFTMAEAILTMTILGVIAAIMIATIKPVQYRNKGFKVKFQKIYADLQDTTNTVMIECSSNWDLATIYNICDSATTNGRTSTHAFGTQTNANELDAYGRYIKFRGDCTVTANKPSTSTCKKMMNDACMCFYKDSSGQGFWVDVNDNDGPNTPNVDQLYWPVSVVSGDTIGITAEKPKDN